LGMALRLAYGTAADALGEEEFPTGLPMERKTNAGAGSTYRRLGEILLDEEMISPAALDTAVDQYASTEPQHLGGYLVQQGLITPEQLEAALQLQGAQAIPEDATSSYLAEDATKETHTKLQETAGE
jgi:hypothetical protein